MSKLQFDEAICTKGTTYDCLTKCQYMNFNLKKVAELRSEDLGASLFGNIKLIKAEILKPEMM